MRAEITQIESSAHAMPRSGFRLNPAVFSDPQVIPQPRGRGRPTLYSPELIEEFCGLIVEGMTIDRACKEVGMPSKRTIKYWLTKYPEFRREYEAAVIFRNQCWMDDCVDIADSHKEGETTSDRKLRIEIRLSQLNGMGLKAVSRPGVCGAGVSELKK